MNTKSKNLAVLYKEYYDLHQIITLMSAKQLNETDKTMLDMYQSDLRQLAQWIEKVKSSKTLLS